MTSPSPGQIARYLKNRYYKTEEEYVFALADVMKREYQAIVEAGFILQLDCPDLAMLRHMVYLDKSPRGFSQDHRRQRRRAQSRGARHARRSACACMCAGARPWRRTTPTSVQGHHRHRARRPSRMAVSFPAANARHEHEWKIWRDVKLPAGKIIIPGVINSTVNTVEHPEVVCDRILNFAKRGRARERHRRRRLRLRHLRRPRPGRQQDRLDEARVARRRGALASSELLWGRRRNNFSDHSAVRGPSRAAKPRN